MENILRSFLLLIFATMFFSTGHAQVQLQWQEVFANTGATSIGINPLDNNVVYVQRAGFFHVSQDRGETWQQRGTIFSFGDRSIVVNPADTSLILIYTGNGIWRTTDGGWNWSQVLLNVSMNGESMEFHPTDPNKVFFAEFFSGNFYVSENAGQTWAIRGNINQRFVCSMSVSPFNPNIILAGGGNTSIMRSTDEGFTWQEVRPGNLFFSEVPKIVWDNDDPNVAYASVQLDPTYSFTKSTDAGASWFEPGLFSVFTWGLDIDPVTGDLYLGSFHDESNRAIFKSYDDGNSWQRVGGIPNPFTWMLKAGNNGSVYSLSLAQTFGIGGVYRVDTPTELGKISGVISDSANGIPLEFAKITVPETGDEISIGNPQGNYTVALLPGTYTLVVTVGIIEKTISNVIVTAGETTNLNIELPLEIQFLPLSGFVHDAGNQPMPAAVTLFGAQNGVVPLILTDTTDASGNFIFEDLSTINRYDSLVVVPFTKPYVPASITSISLPADLDIELDLAAVLLVDASGPGDFQTTRYDVAFNNLGVTWSKWLATVDGETIPPDIVSKVKTNTVVWWTRNVDGIVSEEMLSSLAAIIDVGYNLYISGPNVVQQNASTPLFTDKLRIGYAGDYSTDTFVTGFPGNVIGDNIQFQVSPNFQPSNDVLILNNPTAEAAFHYGMSATMETAAANIDDTGNGGKAVVFGFEASLGTSLSKVFLPVMNRVLTYFDANVVGIEDNVQPIIPQTTELFQNFPNPFNPSTIIEYHLITSTVVELDIYNSLGQKVRELLKKNQPAGQHFIVWDGKNDFGQAVASGIYIYQLKAGNFVDSRKMILMR